MSKYEDFELKFLDFKPKYTKLAQKAAAAAF